MTQERLEEVLRGLDAPEPPDEQLRAACRATIPIPETGQRVRWQWNPFAKEGVKTQMFPRTLALGTAAAVAAIAAFSYGWQKRVAKVEKVASAPILSASNQEYDIDSPDSLAGMWSVPSFRVQVGGLLAGVPFKAGVPLDELIRNLGKRDAMPDGGMDIAFNQWYGRRMEMYVYKTPRVNGVRNSPPQDQIATFSELHLSDGTKIQRLRKNNSNGYQIDTLPDEEPPKGDALNPEIRSLMQMVRSSGGSDVILTYSAELPTSQTENSRGQLRQFTFRGKSFPELKGATIQNLKRPDVVPYLSVDAFVDVASRRLVQVRTSLVWEEKIRLKPYVSKSTVYLLTSRYAYDFVPRSVFYQEDFKKGILRYDTESEVKIEKVEFTPGVNEKTQDYRLILSDSDGTRVLSQQTLKPGQAMTPQTVRAKRSKGRIQILNASGVQVYDTSWENHTITDGAKR